MSHKGQLRRFDREQLTSGLPRIALQKSFWGAGQNFSGGALRSVAVVEPAKNQLLRDFRRRSIFDLCNTPRVQRTCRAGRNTSDFGPKADNGSFSELARKRQAYSAGLSGVDMTVGNAANRRAGQARQVIVFNLVGLRVEEIEHVKLQF
jgi:hypothetical protein